MEYKLKDIVNIKYGKNQKDVVDLNGKYPILGTGGIMGFANKYLYDKPSVLIGRKGTIDKLQYMAEPFWTIDTLFYTEINEDIVIPKYLYYKMKEIDFNSMNEGTTIPSLRTQTLNEIVLKIHSIEKQKKIVEILNAIETKIKLNNHTNDNLLQIGSEILINDFNITKETETLSKIIKFVKGKKPNSIINNRQKGYEKYLTIACLNGQEFNYADTTKMIISDDDLLMVMDGASSGEVYYGGKGIVGSTLARVDCVEDNFSTEFIYFVLKYYKELIQSKNTGSAIPHTDKVFVNSLEIPKINIKQQEKYKVLLSKIHHNQKETETLIQLRDTLLPKLMNGEIDLDKIEI